MMKRILAAVLALCLILPCLALGEDFGLEDMEFDEEIFLDDDFWDDEENEDETVDELSEFIISGDAQEVEENLDALERDPDVDPDSLELNTNLPANVVNILLIGVDTRADSLDDPSALLHNDVTMILSINLDDGSLKLTSLARDLYVQIPGYQGKNRINMAYALGSRQDSANGVNRGAELTMRTVNHLFEMNITQYVVINFYGLATIIQELGGVDLNIIRGEAYAINDYLKQNGRRMTYDKWAADRQPLVVVSESEHESVQHLDGIQAVMYARLRSNMRSAPTGDLARTARQRYLLETLLAKVLQDISVERLSDLISLCFPYVKTNISAGTMLNIALGVLQSGIVSKASNGESLIDQHRIPLDNTYSYQDVSGASVISVTDVSWSRNVQSVHYFIYGEYYPAN